MVDTEKLCDTLLGVFIPPILVFKKQRCTYPFWINLLLFIFVVFWPIAVIHAFHVCGYNNCCHNVLCVLFPPATAFLKFSCRA